MNDPASLLLLLLMLIMVMVSVAGLKMAVCLRRPHEDTSALGVARRSWRRKHELDLLLLLLLLASCCVSGDGHLFAACAAQSS